MVDGGTKVHALYGFPVGHSLSPIIFNATFAKMNVNRTYVAFPVRPDQLKEAVDAARVLDFQGFNVTMPHKTRIVELLDDLENTAVEAGSVNTVSRTPRGFIGHNTDGRGAIQAIRSHGFTLRNRNVLMLGAGGAARSIVRTLANETNVTVLSRDPNKARDIAERAKGKGQVSTGKLTKSSFEQTIATSELLIDATPVPTADLVRSLGSEGSHLPSKLWVFDLAYDKPLETLPPGIKRISPLEMLIQQAALSYEIWMKAQAPVELMRSVLVEHVGSDWK